MSASLASLRRDLAKRMGFWAGDIASGQPGTLTGVQTTTTLVDTVRPEADSEFDNAYICVSPGTANASWRVIKQFTLGGNMTLSSPLSSAPTAGTTYEIFKVGKPEQYLMAINWAITMAYPERHRRFDYSIPEDPGSRVYDYQQIAINQAIANPAALLNPSQLTNVPAVAGTFDAGAYNVAISWVGPSGETMAGPVTSVTLSALDAIKVGPLVAPDGAIQCRYFVSFEAGSSNLGTISQQDMLTVPGQTILPTGGQTIEPGYVNDAQVPAVYLLSGPRMDALSPNLTNTTSLPMLDLFGVHRRINPGQTPEVWNDLGGSGWQPVGGTSIEIVYRPNQQYSLRFLGAGSIPVFAAETDTTNEPSDLILAGAEHQMWALLDKSSTLAAVNWEKLAAASIKEYMDLKGKYAMRHPRVAVHRPALGVWY